MTTENFRGLTGSPEVLRRRRKLREQIVAIGKADRRVQVGRAGSFFIRTQEPKMKMNSMESTLRKFLGAGAALAAFSSSPRRR